MELYFSQLTVLFLCINIITFFYRRFFHLKSTTLNCGLFGFSGTQPPDMNAMKLLGLYNESRGKHSVGYYYNGEIFKGINKLSEWSSFIQTQRLTPVDGANIFIGHTRHATIGSHSEENAHPFHIGNLVLAHNGRVDNIWALLRKYQIDDKQIFVDSKGLAALIEQEGFKVLNEYEGFAALLFHDTEDPNTLCIYHGKSRVKANGEEEPERPLFWMHTKNGTYVSSMEEPLWAIREEDDQFPEVVEYNRIIKIREGKIIKSKSIDRGNCNVKTYVAPTTYNTHYSNSSDFEYDTYSKKYLPVAEVTRLRKEREKQDAKEKVTTFFLNETLPLRVRTKEGSIIYFHKGRYWVRKVLSEAAEETRLATGMFYIDKKGYIADKADLYHHVECFYAGIMLPSVLKYNELLRQINSVNGDVGLKNLKYNFAFAVSEFSTYPVTCLDEGTDCTPEGRYRWYINKGNVATGSFSPKYSDRSYKLAKGYLVSISTSQGDADKPLINFEETKKNEDGFVDDVKGVILQLPFRFTKTNELPKEVGYLVDTYCNRIYQSIEDIEADLPCTIQRAVELYVTDVISEMGHTVNPTFLREACMEFYIEMVNDKVSISDNMERCYSHIEEYVFEAYSDELEKQSNIDATLQSIEDDRDFTDIIDIDNVGLVEQSETDSIIGENVTNSFTSTIDQIENIRNKAEALSLKNEDKAMVNAAAVLYKKTDNMIVELKSTLMTSGDFFGKAELLNRLRKLNSNI